MTVTGEKGRPEGPANKAKGDTSRAQTALEPLLTARDLAPLLGVGVSTLYEWQRKGLIPYIKLPGHGIRFRASDLQTWIESRIISPKNTS
jgi:excisionase family DNA binding protein